MSKNDFRTFLLLIHFSQSSLHLYHRLKVLYNKKDMDLGALVCLAVVCPCTYMFLEKNKSDLSFGRQPGYTLSSPIFALVLYL